MKHDLIILLMVIWRLAGFCVRAVLEAWVAAMLGGIVALATCTAVIAGRRKAGHLPAPATLKSGKASMVPE